MCMVYSTVVLYEDDFRFFIYTKLFNSLDHINMPINSFSLVYL